MEEILNKFRTLCEQTSDINEHLPILKKYAQECSHITEMGTRYIVSTWAFAAAKPKKIVCYDILRNLDINFFNKNLQEIKKETEKNKIIFEFKKENVLDIEIEETDLLFIDTYHVYEQLKEELRLHADKVKKYIIFHDTTTFGEFGETFLVPNTKGIWFAIEEFLNKNNEWVIDARLTNNNGLTILKKIK
jgi:hypothetical protein